MRKVFPSCVRTLHVIVGRIPSNLVSGHTSRDWMTRKLPSTPSHAKWTQERPVSPYYNCTTSSSSSQTNHNGTSPAPSNSSPRLPLPSPRFTVIAFNLLTCTDCELYNFSTYDQLNLHRLAGRQP